jgi:DNA-directed RNA polymerase subunit beta
MAVVAASEREKTQKSFAKLSDIIVVPNLIQVQLDSFRWFQEEGLKELLEEISPIRDSTGNKLELRFTDYEFREPQHSEEKCLESSMTYTAPLYVTAQLIIKETGEIHQQEIFFGDIPLMTDRGTFIISGGERVVVNQLIRSSGIYFTLESDPTSGVELCCAKLIPEHGAWLDFETSSRNVLSVKVTGKRKILVTTLLRAIGFGKDSDLLMLFQDVENSSPDHQYIRSTLDKDALVKDRASALVDIYRKLSSSEPSSLASAQTMINNFLFNPRRYNLGEVGRYKLNKRLGLDIPLTHSALTPEDIVQIVRHMILINNRNEEPDDINHLSSRRTRTVGSLMQNQFRIGLLRLERAIKEHMTIVATEGATPAALINTRPVVAAVREFFGRSQLSQFADQTNPLAELTHKRRISAIGPSGLSRERAGFDVRDVHHSHYGRICPIETPEGPNIGLITSLANYASINKYGFIETPYRRVLQEVPNSVEEFAGRRIQGDIIDSQGHLLIESGALVTEEIAERLVRLPSQAIRVYPFASNQIAYLAADEEEQYVIAEANAAVNERGEFCEEMIDVRKGSKYFKESPSRVDFMDVSPKQIFSPSASLIPFLEHNDANRALMGCNMQRQAVPLLCPQAPLVATGMEGEVAKYIRELLHARNDGVVASVTSSQIVVMGTEGDEDVYRLQKFVRTNQGTCSNQRPKVNKGDRIRKGQVLAEGSSTDDGKLALGQNIVCAFMSWYGYNFEDAVIISRRLVKDDIFTSIHIERYEIEARDTKLGPEEITRDIPNISEESLRNLDEYGIIRIGAEVEPSDILVGKITPKGETELTAEEKLLRAIFGEKTRDVKDNSLRMPPGEQGRVIDVRVFSHDGHAELPQGVIQLVRIWVAQQRKISVGDKMSGRHGNKGVISIILPEEDMPFLPDGTPVDIILNPIGVPSRMNLGQVLEAHLGWAAHILGFRALNPIFDGADDLAVEDSLARVWIAQEAGAIVLDSKGEAGNLAINLEKAAQWLADRGFDARRAFVENHRGEAKMVCLRLWLESLNIETKSLTNEEIEEIAQRLYREQKLSPPIYGKITLRDGRSGEPFDRPVTVGNIYMMKLIHLAGDKVHARSIGPYSLVTQQPLGGKAKFGGQRFGEMEVWALEAYGAAYNLQELLTVKSDDVIGRAKAYEAIVKGEDVIQSGVPESCKVLFMELRSLGFAVELLNEEEERLNLFGEKPRARTRI